LKDAAEAGRKSLSLDDQGIKKSLQGLTDGETEAYRLGAFEALRAKMGVRSGQTQLMNMWREPATREKLREIFGSERAFRTFAAKVAAERRMTGIESVGRGSQTAARQYGAGDIDVPAIDEALSLGMAVQHGNVPAFLTGAASAWNRVKTPEPVRDEIGRILLSRDRGGLLDMQTLLDEINRARARQASSLGIAGGLLATP
jgi:hypothetical protein